MTTNANSEKDNKAEELKKVIAAIFHRTSELLKLEFPEYKIEGHVRYHNIFGPFFPFELIDEANNLVFACGFTFNELLEKLKNPYNAKQWLASFYVDMIKEGVNKPLPEELKNAEEGNKLIRDVILPYCIESIREEFGDNAAHVKFTNQPKIGPVLEAGFPSITNGPNTCAVPLNLLLALHLLNRDCAETVINGLYKIRTDAGLE